MIVKVAPRKAGSQSSFKKLASYITDAPREGEKVLAQWCSNVDGIDMEDAITHIRLEQTLCQGSEADKTYHLIISFPAGERPSIEKIKTIEQQLLDSVGLGTHQRISVIHDDTSHLHLHIAVNKVNVETSKVITPYRDYERLNKTARVLEKEHGLAPLEAYPEDQEKLNGKAKDTESHSKLGAFQRWSRTTLEPEVHVLLQQTSLNWHEVHTALAAHGLILRPRGRGLIITTEDGKFFVKPSVVHREFTRGQLEAKIGCPFEPSKAPSRIAPCRFTAQPLQPSKQAATLYQQYQKHRESLLQHRKKAFQQYKEEKGTAFAEFTKRYQDRRSKLWLDPMLSKKQKSDAAKGLSANRKQALQELRDDFAAQRNTIMAETKLLSWVDYLISMAEKGNPTALNSLRKKHIHYTPIGNHISGTTPKFESLPSDIHYTVAKNGDVSYTTEKGRVVVGERSIHVYGDDEETLKTGLLIAKRRYGNSLKLNGDEGFLQSAQTVANQHKIEIEVNQGMAR